MPVDWPPPPAIVHVYRADAPSPNAAEGQPPPPQPIPQIDLAVEVVGDLPLRTRIQDVTRLLGERQRASRTRRYPPTILELITLVERRPARPPGRRWESITALTIGYDAPTKHVIVEYCLENCGFDPKTRAPHPRRRMASYRAPEETVVNRMNKKLGSLQKYAERPTTPK